MVFAHKGQMISVPAIIYKDVLDSIVDEKDFYKRKENTPGKWQIIV